MCGQVLVVQPGIKFADCYGPTRGLRHMACPGVQAPPLTSSPPSSRLCLSAPFWQRPSLSPITLLHPLTTQAGPDWTWRIYDPRRGVNWGLVFALALVAACLAVWGDLLSSYVGFRRYARASTCDRGSLGSTLHIWMG